MRKVLLTVMMVSSLLAFNACKKDGAVGPVGPAGPTGATGAAGAAGAVGAAGAKGADGTKILSKAGAPLATEGVAGDYSFDTTTKTLWGPKTATAWPATGVALSGADGAKGATGATGANGATGATGAAGATGANGTQFLAGAGVPTNAIGVTGDFYFDTNTSTFYGPKLADGTWGTNVMPLGSSFAAKTYTITRGFESVTEVTAGAPAVSVRQYGQDLVNTYSNYNIFTSYAVTANDIIRINQYAGWGDNREMIFQSNPVGNPGIFDAIPTNGNLTAPNAGTLGVVGGPFQVGSKFRYTNNTANPMAEFTLTQSDIDRLTENSGTSFGYLTYAKALPTSVALGQNLVLAQNKNVQVKTSTTNFATQYTALTKFNLNTLVPNYEKYKQDGKVFVKYKYYTPNSATPATNNVTVLHTGVNAGWIDLTTYANAYVIGTGAAGYGTAGLTDQNPFNGAGINFMSSGAVLGTAGIPVTVGANQVATATTVVGGTNPTTFDKGNIIINWNITSGAGFGNAAVATVVGPTTLQNVGGTDLNPVATASFVPRGFETTYYSTPALTATNNAGTALTISGVAPNQTVPVIIRTGGVEASYYTNTKLVQVQVFVIPGDVVKALKAKGVNTDNLNEISKNIKL